MKAVADFTEIVLGEEDADFLRKRAQGKAEKRLEGDMPSNAAASA